MRLVGKLLLMVSLLAVQPGGAASARSAEHPQVTPDITKLVYDPVGAYGPLLDGGTNPLLPASANTPPTDPNPSGNWVAYDNNVYQSLNFPQRQSGDTTSNDPPGSGDPRYGFCPPPANPPYGQCLNHANEWLDYFQTQMQTILGDFGVVVKRYAYESPGDGSPRGAPFTSPGGLTYNIQAVVPGETNPDESVVVGGHFDMTDSAPATAWDSSDGPAEVMRMAKIMAHYWRATSSRPSATVKFTVWAAEETGLLGSAEWVDRNIPPGEESKVRGYFNLDPCAGAYPAFRNGNPASRVPMVLEVAEPTNYEDPAVKARIESFNARAETIVDEIFDRLDDTVSSAAGPQPIFVSDSEATAVAPSQRDEIVTAVGGLAAFTSDHTHFASLGIPIMNPFPDYFGPHADGTPASAEGAVTLHTPNDNLTHVNRLTNADQTGMTASDGWAKGMELCAQMSSWYMLQPEMGGAEAADTEVTAYFEALPNEAIVNQQVAFDAGGSYQYANPGSRAMEQASALTYEWDFGDGTSGSGKTVSHPYKAIGRYTAKLTVTGAGGKQDSMSIPIEVIGSDFPRPILSPIPQADAEDGNFPLAWDYTGDMEGFDRFGVDESRDYRALFTDTASDMAVNWEVQPPTKPGIEPWQPSDSGTEKFRGNAFRSAPRSFWTGVSPSSFGNQIEPVNGQSILTLKNPISVPAQGDPELSYWSLFQNETDDRGRVEIALTTGSTPPDQLEWDLVDEVSGVCGNNPSHLSAPLQPRRVDLSAYKGKQILVRFVYNRLAGTQVNVFPCGWYVDDITVSHGTWTQIGTSKQEQLAVTGRPNGTVAYRVKAIYTDGITTQASNVEAANITKSSSLPQAELSRCLRAAGNLVLGSDAKETLVGTNGNDVLCGFGGKDKLKGLGGNDVVYAGGGNDLANGGSGNDRLFGEKGTDRLLGGKGKDRLKGGPKRDILKGGAGRDKCGSNRRDRQLKC